MRGVLFRSNEGAPWGAIADALARRLIRPGVEVFAAAVNPLAARPVAAQVLSERLPTCLRLHDLLSRRLGQAGFATADVS